MYLSITLYEESSQYLEEEEAKVLFSIFKYLSPLERVSIKIYKKLFESLVKPVLMYNYEIWYMDFQIIQ
jgi:hypothetical protein